jgi:hypothetical protein
MANAMDTEIDITADGEYAENDDVKIVMTRMQAEALASLLDLHVDLEVVRLDNNDPEGALFIENLIQNIRESLKP